jgi:sulfur-oxidizing protein SoxY
MALTRRTWIRSLIAVSAAVVLPLRVLASTSGAFQARSADDVLKELFGNAPIVASDAVKLKVPDIAENGAVVPISVSTELEGVQSISILIDENPNPLSASFSISPNAFADISTRVKMGKSSPVRAIVQTSDGIFTTSKEVKVTIGGCGG